MKVHPLAIVWGVVTDAALSVIVLPFLMGLFGIAQNASEWLLVLGIVAIAAGGFVTSATSSSAKTFNSVVYGVVEVIISLALVPFAPLPLWLGITSIVLTVPASLLGSYLAIKTLEHQG